jgi:hypothetical protein
MPQHCTWTNCLRLTPLFEGSFTSFESSGQCCYAHNTPLEIKWTLAGFEYVMDRIQARLAIIQSTLVYAHANVTDDGYAAHA